MRIRLAFTNDGHSAGDMPTLIAAVDEYTEDSWGAIPDFYKEELLKYKNVREVNITVQDSDIEGLFSVPTIKSRIDPADLVSFEDVP